MSRAVLRRLATMEPGELRFRLQSGLQKTTGRVRTALVAPRWKRANLTPVLRAPRGRLTPLSAAVHALRSGDYEQAHRDFAAHFSRRASHFPFGSATLPRLTESIRRTFPSAAADAARRADAIVDGRYDVLGYQAVHWGRLPDWHYDPVHDRHAPRTFWASVPFLDPASGDHKIIWELNRHQHWLTLGRAFALTGDRRYYETFTSQLTSWLDANPPLIGTNWASMLELAFRSLSWIAALEYFAPAAGQQDRAPWTVDLLLGLDRQLTHVEQHLSYYFSPNTHLTGEALALYVGGLVLPEFSASARRIAVGREVLIRQATRQILADGGHAELSAHYHRYSTDFFLLALAVARHSADSGTRVFEEAARRQARYLRTIVDENGVRPQLGDDDGGQLWPVCGRDPADCRDTLATAAVLLNEAALALGEIPEETYWMCGRQAEDMAPEAPSFRASAALPESGYYVSRTACGDHLVFDAGPHGFLSGGHSHADALSITLTINRQPFLVDPGTATYTMDPALRDRFRGTAMHNTVTIDGRVQAEPSRPFQWTSFVFAQAQLWRAAGDCDYVEGTHDAYAPRRHTRAILAVHGLGWWILDHILGTGTAVVESYWHFHPSWHWRSTSEHLLQLERETTTRAMATTYAVTPLGPGDHPMAMYSPAYGVVQAAAAGHGRASLQLPSTLATFIPSTSEIADELRIESTPIESPPGAGWHAAAFRVHWRRGTTAILAAIERSGPAGRDTAAPAERWGTAELRTDARVAAVINDSKGSPEAILVNGACIDVHRAYPLVSLPRRATLVRTRTPTVAPSVHEIPPGASSPDPREPGAHGSDV